ncbi:MAG: type II secretion system protein [Magnetococcales bacterium]|nr:type II secretion system protein [Magnetococcales bacterium]
MIILPRKTHQAGFSLIEIAIVLVIIGLLLGGVMKGQTMVQNTKIKRIATDTQSVQASIHAYSDTYWQLPGDDSGAVAHFTAAVVGPGDGDGKIEGLFEPADLDADETARAWSHLRCANLIKGSCVAAATASVLPRNPVGGIVGIADGRASSATVLDMTTMAVCMTNIPSTVAEAYDTLQDDGVGTSGDVLGSANGAAAADATPSNATAYTAGQVVYVCSGF